MTPRTAYSLVWLVLALATLTLLVWSHATPTVIAGVFTAWCGGLVTARLHRLWRARSVV